MKDLARYTQALFQLPLTTEQLASFECLEKELLEWNSRYNLTAIQNPDEIRIKHFLDSLSCLCIMRDSSQKYVIDVGTGAGFPGLPLKIAVPSIHLTLIESVGKKAEFCRHMVKLLDLDNVEVVQDRAENLGQSSSFREKYDWALGRAVARIPVLAEYLLPLVRIGGAMVAMKGENAPAEAHGAENAFKLLGGKMRKLIPVTLPGVSEERYLVLVDKIAATPLNYPRRIGIPAKRPL